MHANEMPEHSLESCPWGRSSFAPLCLLTPSATVFAVPQIGREQNSHVQCWFVEFKCKYTHTYQKKLEISSSFKKIATVNFAYYHQGLSTVSVEEVGNVSHGISLRDLL